MKFLTANLLLLSTILLQACGGGGSSSGNEPPESPDPLIAHQWSLYNGGVPGADMNGFSSNNLEISNYAGGYTGKNIEIAIIDTGLEIGHEDLQANVIENGSYNFSHASNGKSKFDTTAITNDGDHGTGVAGIAAARGVNGIGIMGVAPKASLRGFNLLSNATSVNELASLGYQDSVQNFPGMVNNTVSVFNKSYGTNPDKVLGELDDSEQTILSNVLDVMKEGTEQLRQGKGALYVKAAGNEYYGGQAFTQSYCSEAIAKDITCYNASQEPENVTPYQIVVGAFNASDERSSYSNTGSAIWVVAPGGEFGDDAPAIMTTDQSGCASGYSRDETDISPNTSFNRGTENENTGCNYYSAFNGTSSATPAVSGAVALILSANPNARWRDVKYILAKTARKLDEDLAETTMTLESSDQVIDQAWVTNAAGYHFSNAYGFGAVDILNAVALAKTRQSGDLNLSSMIVDEVPLQEYSTQNIIKNETKSGLSKIINATSNLTIESVELVVDISATDSSSNREDNKIDASDYLIELTSPSGTKSILMTPFNAFLSGVDMPNFKMISNAFYGESSIGVWTLKITDVDGNTANYIKHVGEGKLNKFGLTIYGHYY